MSTETRDETVERLVEIKDEIKEMMREAYSLLKDYPGARDTAKHYWMAHIEMALDDEHGYLGGSMVTLQDTIDEIDPGDEEE